MTHYLKSFVMLLLSFPFIVSCENYDDKDLWDAVNSLDDRVTSIEKQLETLNGDIQTVSTLVELLRTRTYVTKVTDKGDGYELLFSDGSRISISNGKDGDDGKDGQDAPVINVRLSNGKYYWVQTYNGQTTWLLDTYGNKIPVSGKDAVTPLLKVDSDGYWIISYDDGKSYSTMIDEKGNAVKASGDDGDSYFDIVEVDGENLHLILKDGTELFIPIGEQPLYKAVDLGVSVRWASVNLGATSDADAGELYLWGDADNTGVVGWYEAPDVDNICGTMYDPARVMLGDSWRMPSQSECAELIRDCDWEKATVNGMNGVKVTGDNGNSIFFPTTGYGIPQDGPAGSMEITDTNSGYYWSGESYNENSWRYAYVLLVSGNSANSNASWIANMVKMAIRPVKDK